MRNFLETVIHWGKSDSTSTGGNCVDNVWGMLQETQNPVTHVVVMLSPDGTPQWYNKGVMSKDICRACPAGFSFHVLACSVDERGIPATVYDPSASPSLIGSPFCRYLDICFSKPEAPESELEYFVVTVNEFNKYIQSIGKVDKFDPRQLFSRVKAPMHIPG